MTRFNFADKFVSNPDWSASSKTASALLFAVLLIVCSIAVGCSSEKPQSISSNQTPVSPNPTPLSMTAPSAPISEPTKPAAKKIVHRRPPTVTYVDKTNGVSFDYPRRYAIETGNAASELVTAIPLPMNFVQPGGTALAAVELPETSFPSTDYSSAFFSVSVNKSLSAPQCEEFSLPQPKSSDHSAATATGPSKLMLGDMELYGAEAVTGDGPRQSDSKYFHVFENGACYEFTLNVTTNASEIEAGMKHVDRDKVFDRLAKILATVKISPVAAPEETASTPATPDPSLAPAAPEKLPATASAASDAPKAEGSTASAGSDPNASSPGKPVTPTAATAPAAQGSTETSPQ
jgi:hypothetical protein